MTSSAPVLLVSTPNSSPRNTFRGFLSSSLFTFHSSFPFTTSVGGSSHPSPPNRHSARASIASIDGRPRQSSLLAPDVARVHSFIDSRRRRVPRTNHHRVSTAILRDPSRVCLIRLHRARILPPSHRASIDPFDRRVHSRSRAFAIDRIELNTHSPTIQTCRSASTPRRDHRHHPSSSSRASAWTRSSLAVPSSRGRRPSSSVASIRRRLRLTRTLNASTSRTDWGDRIDPLRATDRPNALRGIESSRDRLRASIVALAPRSPVTRASLGPGTTSNRPTTPTTTPTRE